jgi:hypothetical protein
MKLFILMLSFFPLQSFAQHGGVGGGDQCKNEIDKHRLQILGWIERDEAADLDFTLAKIPGQTYATYKAKMLPVLAEGKVIVTCYLDPARIADPVAQAIAAKDGVSYRAITVGNPAEPSSCINYEDANGVSHIDCNYDSIMNENSLGNPDYINTHHEYAAIAGVETRDYSPSDMSLSKQLSQFEHKVTTTLLGPKLTDAEDTARIEANGLQYVSYRVYSTTKAHSMVIVPPQDLDRAKLATEMFLNNLGFAEETRDDVKADLDIAITLEPWLGTPTGDNIEFQACKGVLPDPSYVHLCYAPADRILDFFQYEQKLEVQPLDLSKVLKTASKKLMQFQDHLTNTLYQIYNPRRRDPREPDYGTIESKISNRAAELIYHLLFTKRPLQTQDANLVWKSGIVSCSRQLLHHAEHYACGAGITGDLAKEIFLVGMSGDDYDRGQNHKMGEAICTKQNENGNLKYRCEFVAD